jgi:hypothetical protein
MKRPNLLMLALATATLTTTLAAPVASQYGNRGDRGRSSATFYVKDDFGGRGVTVDRPIRSFREFDMNDKASSVRIEGGPWLVCEDDDFRGRCEQIDRSIGRLGRIGMDDTISSARPLGGGGDRDGNQGNWGGANGNGNNGGNNGGNWGGGGNGGGMGGGNGGRLPGGSWAQSCRGGQMSGATLRAECNDGARWRMTQIEPRQCPSGRVGNNNGNLTCE